MENNGVQNAEGYPPKLRWYRLTPGRWLLVLLAVEGLLLLSERFHWFFFNEKKGWTVLIAVAAVVLTIALTILWYAVALCFRWKFQFSIRSLLVLTVAVALPFSWLAVEMKWAREQKEAVEAIVKLDAYVLYDYEMDSSGRYRVEGQNPATPEWLRTILGDDFFMNVAFVEFANPKATDDDVIHLKVLGTLPYLNLEQTQTTDAGLEQLGGLAQLKELNLTGTRITDEGLKHLARMKQLEQLNLSDTRVTDAGLAHLKELNHLQYLILASTQFTLTGLINMDGQRQLNHVDLNSTPITDAGLEHLAGLKQLKLLRIYNTQVTDSGIEKLRKALPNCKIERVQQ
jgi:hypothetical protein